MRYLLSVIDHATGTATPDEMRAIDAFNEALVASDQLVLACGLAEPSRSVVIDHRGDTPVVCDGPLLQSEEYVSGLWIVEASGLDEARQIATGASKACRRKVELRPFYGG